MCWATAGAAAVGPSHSTMAAVQSTPAAVVAQPRAPPPTAATVPPTPAAHRRRQRHRRRPIAACSSDKPPALRTPRPVPSAPLGATGIVVPRVCLGTMLFGGDGGTGTGECSSNNGGIDFATASRLMSACAESGAAFFDSSEMYPVPPSEATWGRSEDMLGRWANEYGRSKTILMTKISGPGNLPWLRNGPAALDPQNIAAAVDGSLRRLKTDHLDLVLLHWPDRWVPMFGDRDYDPNVIPDYPACPLEEQLEALGKIVSEGKARAVGLSNETAWGIARCAALAEFRSDLPRVAAVQNGYNLLCRTAEVGGGVMEACDRENVGLLAYAPLAAGHLSGKYLPSPQLAGPRARLNKFRGRYAEAEMRYAFDKPGLREAAQDYVSLAAELGMTPAALALRFVLSRPGRMVPSAVIGATSEEQLAELLDAAAGGDGRGGGVGGEVGLPGEALARVNAIHERHPNPLP